MAGKRIKELNTAESVLGTNMLASDPESGGTVKASVAQISQYVLQFAMRSVIELPANTDFDLIRIGQTVGGYVITHGQSYSVEINDSAVAQSKKIKNDWNTSTTWGNGVYIINNYGLSSNQTQTVTNVATTQKADRYYSGSSWMSLTVGGVANIYWWVDNEIYATGLTGTGFYSGWFNKRKNGLVEQGGLLAQTQNPTIVFLIPMANDGYNIHNSWLGGKSANFFAADCSIQNITANGFLTNGQTNANVKQRDWEIKGKAA
jgi:hypothetical protein